MSFNMPTVDFTLVPEQHRDVMREIVHHDKLVVKPTWDCSPHAKMVHHLLLKFLYRDSRWCVPLCNAWYMPHLVKIPDEATLNSYLIDVDEIYHSGCFGSPQPVYIGDKQYLITREDGSTFIMTVA